MDRQDHRVSLEDLRPPPGGWPGEISGLLIPEDRILARIAQLAEELAQEYRSGDPVLLGILDGSFVFLADLVRRLSFPFEVDFAGLSSYREGTLPGELELRLRFRRKLEGRRVLLVDDILDRGRTLGRLAREVARERPLDVRVCVLLERSPAGDREIRADHSGFQVPECFVVGYGMDYRGRHRNLRSIGVLEEE